MKKKDIILLICVIIPIAIMFIVLINMNLPSKVNLNPEMEENPELITDKYINDLNRGINNYCDSVFTRNKDYCNMKCMYTDNEGIHIGLVNNNEQTQKDFLKKVVDSNYISFDAVCGNDIDAEKEK